MVESYVGLGGKYRLGAKVTGISTRGSSITEIEINGGERIALQRNDRIVSTMPFHKLASMLGIKNNLQYRGARLVYVSLAKPLAIKGVASFLYFPQPHLPFHRLSEQKKFCQEGWPADTTTLVAEIAFSEDDNSNFDEGKLISEVIDGLVEYGLAQRSEILETKCISLPHVYPLLTRSKEIELASTASSVREYAQLYLIGTGGEYHYADIQILYSKGRDLAERIIEEQSQTIDMSRLKSEEQLRGSKYFPTEPFVIAEIGLNHGGSYEVARDIMLKAKESGAKYVKFQTYKAENRVSKVYRSNNYFEEVIDTEHNLFEMFKKCEFTEEEWVSIFEYGREIGLNVFSAVFDLESLSLLERLNCPAYKIASMDLNNYPLIREIAKTRKPVILSTGMASLGEIEKSVNILISEGIEELIILHCVSSYPANSSMLNLRAMDTLRNAFGFPVGFSDHTIGIEAGIVAVSIGAACIEKHFTLDHSLEGPDHLFSLDPEELKALIDIVNLVPDMLGESFKITTRQEMETSYKFKKSLHARKRIEIGEVYSMENIAIKGPNGGISVDNLEIIIGRKATNVVEEDFPITWSAV